MRPSGTSPTKAIPKPLLTPSWIVPGLILHRCRGLRHGFANTQRVANLRKRLLLRSEESITARQHLLRFSLDQRCNFLVSLFGANGCAVRCSRIVKKWNVITVTVRAECNFRHIRAFDLIQRHLTPSLVSPGLGQRRTPSAQPPAALAPIPTAIEHIKPKPQMSSR
jgi:hypothetical protein